MTYMLLMEVLTQTGDASWIVDYGMTLTDCFERMKDWTVPDPSVYLTCEVERGQ